MRIRWKDFELPTRVLLDEKVSNRTFGKFLVEPFEKGFAATLGNALRRTLYSSIAGSAATSLKIKGVAHEFASIRGVLEDAADLVLNFKQILVKLADGEPKTLTLRAARKGEVKAGMIEAVPGVEVLNPELRLCTLTDDVEFNAELRIARGRGYVPAEEHAKALAEPGWLPMDSVFSPVVRVRYSVENTRVGKATDYERLILEVWTNGSASPEEALVEAAKILRKHINPFVMYFEIGRELQINERREEEMRRKEKWLEELRQKLSMSISELDLSVRSANCISAEKIETIGELVQRSEQELLKVRNFGKTSLREVKKKLADFSLTLGMNLEEVHRTKRFPYAS